MPDRNWLYYKPIVQYWNINMDKWRWDMEGCLITITMTEARVRNALQQNDLDTKCE